MNRELVMATLFARLTGAPCVFNFSANLIAGDPTLYAVPDTSGLLVGMPVFGAGVAAEATVATMTPFPTLSVPATETLNNTPLSQGFQTIGRRLKPLSEDLEQPALFLTSAREHFPGLSGAPTRQSSGPAQITLAAEAWVYARVVDPDAVPDTLLNTLLDALSQALDPAPTSPTGFYQNLGLSGVLHARIEGEVERWGGHLDGQAVALVPIVVRVAQSFPVAPLA